MEQEKIEGDEQQAAHVREHAVKLEAELQKVCDGILTLMDDNPIPSAGTGESKVFHCKMKGDDCRYLADCANGDTKSKAVGDAHATEV